MEVPKGNWKLVLNRESIDENGLGQHQGGSLKIDPIAAMILVQE